MNVFYKRFLFSIGIILCLMTDASADYRKISQTGDSTSEKVTIAKIYYTGGINIQKTNELIGALDDLNMNYRNLGKIYLYINSYGGDMDSGYIAYQAIKSSRIPVVTVNLATVMSAATMLFCGASERSSFEGAQFIMHPAAISQSSRMQPDQLEMAQQTLGRYNQMLVDIYKGCSDFREGELKSILYSEDQRKVLSSDEARKRGVVTELTSRIADAQVSYFVSDGNSK
ncbi:ATP-dependent Clp protease proteolytic subunit [Paraburkholderia adhaesiva]|uniref:ATP-dependent Clp protease proteolytic subunit n=1 Tax=Paraburkholderia adhaesiva TaxID=2883244 RepID=UPI001F3A56B4|nr:ATP-dependent Clp protease proteolytic subunit [Paraburkholderia adhaesiva]